MMRSVAIYGKKNCCIRLRGQISTSYVFSVYFSELSEDLLYIIEIRNNDKKKNKHWYMIVLFYFGFMILFSELPLSI